MFASIHLQELRFPTIMTLVMAGLWSLTVMAHNGQEAERGYYPAPDPTLFARLQAESRAEMAAEARKAAQVAASAAAPTADRRNDGLHDLPSGQGVKP